MGAWDVRQADDDIDFLWVILHCVHLGSTNLPCFGIESTSAEPSKFLEFLPAVLEIILLFVMFSCLQ